MLVNIKRDCNGESPFRWLRMTQSPYYTFILWKRNFILTEHTIDTFIFHVKYVFSPTFPSPNMFTNLAWKRTDMSWTFYLHASVTKCDSQLNGLREYCEESRVFTLISVLCSSDKTVVSYHMLHKQSDVCSYASYNQSCYWAIVAFWNSALYHSAINSMFHTTNFILLLLLLLFLLFSFFEVPLGISETSLCFTLVQPSKLSPC